MAWEIGDSFDFAATNDLILGGSCWTVPWSFVSVTNATTRFGVGQSIFISGGVLTSVGFNNDTVIYINAALMMDSSFTNTFDANACGFMLSDGSNNQVGIYWKGDGKLYVTNGLWNGTIIAGPSNQFYFSGTEWHHNQIKVVINNTTGSVELRVDGHTTNDATFTGLNTRNGSTNSYANKLTLVSGSGNVRYDDFYLFNDQGAAPNTWQGDIRASQLMPSSDVLAGWARSSGSTNASCVDENQEDGDTTYVSAASPYNQVDRYGTSALAVTPGSIINCVTKAFVRMDDSGPHSVKTRLWSGATQTDSSTISTGSQYRWLWQNYLVDPNTSAAWTATNVNAANIGPVAVS